MSTKRLRAALATVALTGALAACGTDVRSPSSTATTKSSVVSTAAAEPTSTTVVAVTETTADTSALAAHLKDAAAASLKRPVHYEVSMGSTPFAVGTLDPATNQGTTTIDFSSFAAGLEPMSIVLDGFDMYIKLGGLGSSLGMPAGKTWVHYDASHGSSSLTGASSDPREMLDYFNGLTAPVSNLGRETIRDVKTTHYATTVAFADMLRHQPPQLRTQLEEATKRLDTTRLALPLDVWIDEAGALRRLSLDATKFTRALGGISTANLPASLSVQVWDFVDYDQPVVIELPPADQVAEVADVPRLAAVLH